MRKKIKSILIRYSHRLGQRDIRLNCLRKWTSKKDESEVSGGIAKIFIKVSSEFKKAQKKQEKIEAGESLMAIAGQNTRQYASMSGANPHTNSSFYQHSYSHPEGYDAHYFTDN